jgi:hypothetical protein
MFTVIFVASVPQIRVSRVVCLLSSIFNTYFEALQMKEDHREAILGNMLPLRAHHEVNGASRLFLKLQ